MYNERMLTCDNMKIKHAVSTLLLYYLLNANRNRKEI